MKFEDLPSMIRIQIEEIADKIEAVGALKEVRDSMGIPTDEDTIKLSKKAYIQATLDLQSKYSIDEIDFNDDKYLDEFKARFIMYYLTKTVN